MVDRDAFRRTADRELLGRICPTKRQETDHRDAVQGAVELRRDMRALVIPDFMITPLGVIHENICTPFHLWVPQPKS